MSDFVSVILPCRNEENFIKKCLGSILEQDYLEENLEVLVVDGQSQDNTRKIVFDFSKKYNFIKLIDNPKKFTPFALNEGIKQARGDIIIRMDVHAEYKKDYISKCVNCLNEYKVDNVGGIMKTLPAEKSIIASAIALCLSNIFGAASYFRVGAKKPIFVDTVFGGCYRKEIFKKIGLFNENLIRSQDMELNLRLKKFGGKIMLFPDIVSYYYPSVDFKDFWAHNFSDGFWAIYPLKFVKIPLKLRHYIPLIFILTLPLSIWLYIPVNLFFSFFIALKHGFKYFLVMPFVFINRHFGYGFGSLWGLIKLFIC